MGVAPFSYATRLSTSIWLGPLPHADMVFPTSPKMAKKAEIGQNGPHSGSHISMVMTSNNLTKVAIDIGALGPNICPKSTLEVGSNYFLP